MLDLLGRRWYQHQRTPTMNSLTIIPILLVSPMAADQVKVKINGKHVSFILDTGDGVTLVHKNLWQRIKPSSLELSPRTGRNLVGTDGTKIEVLGFVSVLLQLKQIVYSTDVMVSDSLTTDGTLGLNLLESNSCTGRCTQQYGNANVTVPPTSPSEPLVSHCAVVLAQTICIRTESELEVMAETMTLLNTSFYLMEPTITCHSVRAARTLVCPSTAGVPAWCINPGFEPIAFHKGTKTVELEAVHDLTIGPVTEIVHGLGGKADLSPAEQAQLWKMVEDKEERLSVKEVFCWCLC